jgi:hypothetical protein
MPKLQQACRNHKLNNAAVRNELSFVSTLAQLDPSSPHLCRAFGIFEPTRRNGRWIAVS